MLQLSGGQALVRMLENLGVEAAFGVPGFQALPYYMAIHHSKTMRHILVRNEQAGAFMADAYYRASGKVAVCDGTCGPGATNLITGLSESYNASVPVIAVTSNVVTANSGRGANMETWQREAIAPFVKETIYITDARRIPELVRKAYSTAVSGKPGPVHIDMPEDVFYAECEYEETAFACAAVAGMAAARFTPARDLLDRAVEMLLTAKNPVMLCGGGAHNSGAWKAVQGLAEMMNMPVATTIGGKGVLAEDHPLSLGIFGRYFRFANEFVSRSDLVLVVGCKLGEMSTIRWSLIKPGTAIIHIEIDPATINKAYPTDLGLVGDARATLEELALMLRNRGVKQNKRAPIYEEIASSAARWRAGASDKIEDAGTPINIAHMLDVLRQQAPRDTVMVGDGGFSAHWSSVFWTTNCNDGRHYIANRGQAAIGYGLPGALGAKCARPEKTVVTLSGDGGIAYSLMELETAVREKLPVILIVVNNKCLGYIKALEHLQFGEYASCDLLDVCYADMAKVLGCYGVRVTDPADLAEEFRQAIARKDRPSVIEVMVTTDPAKMLPGVDNRIKKKG